MYCAAKYTTLCWVAVVVNLQVKSAYSMPHNSDDDIDTRNECVTEGRFPYADDCGSFVDCIFKSNGQLETRSGSCKGYQFNPISKQCTTEDILPGCMKRTSRALVSDHSLNYACADQQTGFICSDCKTLVNCLNGTAYPEPCGSGYLCYESDLFGGGVCYPGKPDECLCAKPNEFKMDKYDNHSFYFCESMDTDPQVYRCPEDMEFNVETSQCLNVNGLPPCSKIGVFANPYDCSYYYTCIMSTEGWVHKRFSCQNESHADLMFNEESGQCEDPCTWDTGKFQCMEEGRFSDPSNCNQYHECISLPTDPVTYRKTLRECPINYEWDSAARGGVGHCVPKDSRVSKCELVTPNVCSIPEGMCLLSKNAIGNLI